MERRGVDEERRRIDPSPFHGFRDKTEIPRRELHSCYFFPFTVSYPAKFIFFVKHWENWIEIFGQFIGTMDRFYSQDLAPRVPGPRSSCQKREILL